MDAAVLAIVVSVLSIAVSMVSMALSLKTINRMDD